MFALDTNIIVYALDADQPAKQTQAQSLLARALQIGSPLPRQVLGELLNLGHKRGGDRLVNHRRIVEQLEAAGPVIDTDASSMATASNLAERYRLQYFDALICAVAMAAGATILVTEDMQDGLQLGAMRLINPFVSGNAALVAEMLAART